MVFFRYFTPVSYWILIILWLIIFIFYVKRIHDKRLSSKLFITLLTILAIDAFRTLFESVYFGFWYTSLVGFIPEAVHDILVRPENVFVPKIINVIAAMLVILIVLRRWIPEETAERERDIMHTQALEHEINERKAIQEKLAQSEEQLIEAQKLARVGHYILNTKERQWSSSAVLDQIFGIEREYIKDVDGWVNLIHPDDRQMMISYLEKDILTEHREFNKEYRIVNAHDDETLWVHGIGHLKLDKEGRVYEMFGTVQDITEHKRLVTELEEALDNVKLLSGLIPICSRCKDIRDDKGYWNQLEKYLDKHSRMSFSHSLCPKCAKELYGKEEWFHKIKEDDQS